MNLVSKILVPNKIWIIKNENNKVGSIQKLKKGYEFLKNGKSFIIPNSNEIKNILGIDLPSASKLSTSLENFSIYNYPCNSNPHNSVYDIRRKLPLFSKSEKSKSQYCAGYYIINFQKGWVKSFCPKLITLERYPYQGPFFTEKEMKAALNHANKSETIEYDTDRALFG